MQLQRAAPVATELLKTTSLCLNASSHPSLLKSFPSDSLSVAAGTADWQEFGGPGGQHFTAGIRCAACSFELTITNLAYCEVHLPML